MCVVIGSVEASLITGHLWDGNLKKCALTVQTFPFIFPCNSKWVRGVSSRCCGSVIEHCCCWTQNGDILALIAVIALLFLNTPKNAESVRFNQVDFSFVTLFHFLEARKRRMKSFKIFWKRKKTTKKEAWWQAWALSRCWPRSFHALRKNSPARPDRRWRDVLAWAYCF